MLMAIERYNTIYKTIYPVLNSQQIEMLVKFGNEPIINAHGEWTNLDIISFWPALCGDLVCPKGSKIIILSSNSLATKKFVLSKWSEGLQRENI